MIFSRPANAPAAHEENVGCIDLEEFLLRVLAAALRRHRSDGSFHDLEQGLLHALARHVAGDRRIVGFPANFVDLVDIDDAALRPLDIIVGGLEQLEDDVLDVLADIARLGQRRGVGHGEWHVEDARERLRQQGLAATGWADQQDVRLGELDVGVLARVVEALVVVVHGHRKHALGVILADDVVVQNGANFHGGGYAIARLHQRALVLLADDVHAKLDAFIADENRRPGNELANLVLALAAEGAVEGVFGVGSAHLAHSFFQSSRSAARAQIGPSAIVSSCRLASVSPLLLRRNCAKGQSQHAMAALIKD